MKLSILIPSNRAEALGRFIESFEKNTKIKDDIQLVILVDDNKNYIENAKSNFVIVHKQPESPLNMSNLNYECYKASDGEWIMFGNDDCIIETENWDDQIRFAMNHFSDGFSLIYPNDGMFGQMLACFPIIPRKVIEITNLFPMKYQRYKIDDTIFSMFPVERRIYLPNCKFTHLNHSKEGVGFKLPDGDIYPIIQEVAAHDTQIWNEEEQKRSHMSKILNAIIGIKVTKILVGVSTAEMARRAVFYDYFNLLDKPPGTILTMAHGQSPAKARNLIIEQALQHQCSHVLFIDDDIAFEPNLLTKLLSHDKDIVTGFMTMRNYPHRPLVFSERRDDGSCAHFFPKDGQYGLQEIVNCGLGCVLIKTDVFRKMERPWVTLGELTKDDWCDDIAFFNRAQKAGFKMYVDLDCLVGHMASLTVFPRYIDGKWMTVYDTTGEGQVSFPMLRPNAVN